MEIYLELFFLFNYFWFFAIKSNEEKICDDCKIHENIRNITGSYGKDNGHFSIPGIKVIQTLPL